MTCRGSPGRRFVLTRLARAAARSSSEFTCLARLNSTRPSLPSLTSSSASPRPFRVTLLALPARPRFRSLRPRYCKASLALHSFTRLVWLHPPSSLGGRRPPRPGFRINRLPWAVARALGPRPDFQVRLAWLRPCTSFRVTYVGVVSVMCTKTNFNQQKKNFKINVGSHAYNK